MEELPVTAFDCDIGELDLPKLLLLPPDKPLVEAIKYFNQNSSAVLGVGTENKLSGIVSEWDLVHQFSPDVDPNDLVLSDMMIENPVVLYSENSIYEVMNVMGRRNFSCFPVCDENGLPTNYFSIQVLFSFITSYFPTFLEELGTKETWEPTKSVQAFAEGFNFSETMEDDSSLHQNYFLTPFERISSSKLIKADEGITIAKAWELMIEYETEVLVLTRFGTKLVGILTTRDMITKVLVKEGNISLNEPVKNYMTENPHSLMYKHPIGFGINQFVKYNYKHMIIVDEDRIPLKVVSLLEIFSHL